LERVVQEDEQMSREANILLVTWDGAGNLPPERSLVRALVARGHTVRALAHDSVRELLERDGAGWLPLRGVRHYDSREAMLPNEEMPFVTEHIWFAKAFGSELLGAVDQVRPDLLLVDICLSYALVAARHCGVPTAVLGHFPYHLMVGPFAPLFGSRLSELNAYASEFGIAPFPSHRALIEVAPLVLVPTYRAFDQIEASPPNVVHVGPCRSPGGERDNWRRRDAGRPLVVVGFSTSHQNQVSLLQRLCDALGNLEVEALVTTGPAIAPESLRASDNTTVLRFVAHDDVLPSADLLITHAGHGTVMAGVTYGVPMLCFPMGRDQPLIADRVAGLGLGSVVNPDAAVAEIRQAIAATLADEGVSKRTRDFSGSLVDHPGLDQAVGLIERLLAGQP
jgi:UDP:flavonoid glycosyltransferase YjiC (YdhE family)